MMSNIPQTSIKELMNSPAYWNAAYPDSEQIRQRVTAWFAQQYGDDFTNNDQKIHVAYFIDRIKMGKTLFVGEGNLSFALSIATLPDVISSNMIVTAYEEGKDIPDQSKENVELLRKLGVVVQFGVDATHLEQYRNIKFKTIIFQFPHTGSREPLYGHNPNFVLIRRFLKSAKEYLEQDGQIIISTVDNPHYRGAFRLEEAAKETGYNRPDIFDFDPEQFAGYSHINTNDDDSAIQKHDKFSTWIFTKNLLK
jgi:25S rRNA (uracil2634-N3)-methyltransferase